MGKDKEARRSVGRLPCSPEGKRSPRGLMLGRGCSGEEMLLGTLLVARGEAQLVYP